MSFLSIIDFDVGKYKQDENKLSKRKQPMRYFISYEIYLKSVQLLARKSERLALVWTFSMSFSISETNRSRKSQGAISGDSGSVSVVSCRFYAM